MISCYETLQNGRGSLYLQDSLTAASFYFRDFLAVWVLLGQTVWKINLFDVTAVVGAVDDPVPGDVCGSGHPAHPQHTVGDHRELNAQRWWERDCSAKQRTFILSVLLRSNFARVVDNEGESEKNKSSRTKQKKLKLFLHRDPASAPRPSLDLMLFTQNQAARL